MENEIKYIKSITAIPENIMKKIKILNIESWDSLKSFIEKAIVEKVERAEVEKDMADNAANDELREAEAIASDAL